MDLSNDKRNLVFSLLGICVIFLVANLLDQEQYPITEDWYATDLLFIIVPSSVIILGLILIGRYKIQGNHAKAWILFTLAVVIWFVGEWTYEYDYEYELSDPSTYFSDIFYILGYPLFFGFSIFYLKTWARVITKKMILAASLISLIVIIPSLYLTLENEDEVDSFTLFLYVIYPILDGLILAPAIIATFLFFRGQVNLLWALILIATLFDVAADTIYLNAAIEESYYPGHPIDILYLWAYVMYAFGALSHIKLFKKPAIKT